MPQLKIYSENDASHSLDYSDFESIKKELAKVGIDIQQWTSNKACLNKKASADEVLAAFADEVSRIKKDYSFAGVDVVSMNQSLKKTMSTEKFTAMREKFLAEHTHSDDEVRFFVEGSGLFCVHANDRVYAITCFAGDFIAVPADTKHWFDMGSEPDFRCIRFFEDESGWLADYSGDDIAEKFPNFDQLCKKESLT